MKMSKGHTFISLFDKVQKSHADQECYISYDGNMERRSIAFKDLWTLASRFAYSLRQHGLQRGDSVVVSTPMSLEYVVASFGVVFAGGVNVSMEKFFPKCKALKKSIKLSSAKFILMTDSIGNDIWPFFEPNATKVDGQTNVVEYEDRALPSLKKIVFTNKEGSTQNPVPFLDQLRSCQNEFRDVDLDPETGCICTFSAGQDLASPKVIELSHRAVVNMAGLYWRYAKYGKCYNKWPWYHAGGLPYGTLNGAARVFTDTFNRASIGDYAQQMVNVFQSEGISMTILGSSDIKAIAECETRPNKKLVDHLLTGGQPMTSAVYEIAQKISTNVHIVYCLSETNYVTTNFLTPQDAFTPFDSGIPLDGVEIRILGEQNEDLPQGKTGRIAIRNPYLFTRYPGQPALTKSVLKDDGWFYSNDAGLFSPDGHLHVFGRQGDVISRGMILIYPAYIEKPIMNIPEVMQVVAVAVPDEHNFRNTCACVVLRPGSQLTEEDIHRKYQESVKGEAAAITFPLDHVVFFDGALPRIPRDKLGEMATEKLDDLIEKTT